VDNWPQTLFQPRIQGGRSPLPLWMGAIPLYFIPSHFGDSLLKKKPKFISFFVLESYGETLKHAPIYGGIKKAGTGVKRGVFPN